jgi:hypothetical protein
MWRLRAQGLTYAQIGRDVGVSSTCVKYRLNPVYRERALSYREKRYHAEPEYRELVLGKLKAKRGWHYLRKQARDEAKETGEPVEQIYARWGVASN